MVNGQDTASQGLPWLRRAASFGRSSSASAVVESDLPRRLPSFNASVSGTTKGAEAGQGGAGDKAEPDLTPFTSRSTVADSEFSFCSERPAAPSNVVLSFSMDMPNGGTGKEGSMVFGEDVDGGAGEDKSMGKTLRMEDEGPLSLLKSTRPMVLGVSVLLAFFASVLSLHVEWWVFRYTFTDTAEVTTTYDWSVDLGQECVSHSLFCIKYESVVACVYVGVLCAALGSVLAMASAYKHIKTFGFGAVISLTLSAMATFAAAILFQEMVSDQEEYWSSDWWSYGYGLNWLSTALCLILAVLIGLHTHRTEIYFETEEDLTLNVKGGQMLRLMRQAGQDAAPFSLRREWMPLPDLGGGGEEQQTGLEMEQRQSMIPEGDEETASGDGNRGVY